MSFAGSVIPSLCNEIVPPLVSGTADLTSFAYQGNDHPKLLRRMYSTNVHNRRASEAAGWTYDSSILAHLTFKPEEAADLLRQALEMRQMFRIAPTGVTTGVTGNVSADQPPLRLLALVGPGDLMANAPLDFLTNHLNVRLDLLYLMPDRPLPDPIPDHDVAFFAVGEADSPTLARLQELFKAWPRPVLNDPRFLPAMARDRLSASLAGVSGIHSPVSVAVRRAALEGHSRAGHPIPSWEPAGPYLIRPLDSHAGNGLSRISDKPELAAYLEQSSADNFFLTPFVDYSGPDGLFRKSRVAFIDRRPFLCHMAVSDNWMVHYLNAGMTESADKRAEEAAAMASFDDGFAQRHAAAFDALHERLGFDYYSIDCAETRDGRLLVFEADSAAIVHLMDPPDLFPYKPPQMRKVFAAFETMLRRRASQMAAIAS